MTSDDLLSAAHDAINSVARDMNTTIAADSLRKLKDNINSWLKQMGYGGGAE